MLLELVGVDCRLEELDAVLDATVQEVQTDVVQTQVPISATV